jgi:CAP-Gly domain
MFIGKTLFSTGTHAYIHIFSACTAVTVAHVHSHYYFHIIARTVKPLSITSLMLYARLHTSGVWVGVRLTEGHGGKNSGTVNGVHYFVCEHNAGMFVRPHMVDAIVSAPASPVHEVCLLAHTVFT